MIFLLKYFAVIPLLFLASMSSANAEISEPHTTTENGNIAFRYSDETAIKIAPRGNNTSCEDVGEGGLRYNDTIKNVQFCDGTNWITPPDYKVVEGAAAAVNYPDCTDAFTNWRSVNESLTRYYESLGSPGRREIHIACREDQVFVGSDLAPHSLPSSYISGFCCPIGLTPE